MNPLVKKFAKDNFSDFKERTSLPALWSVALLSCYGAMGRKRHDHHAQLDVPLFLSEGMRERLLSERD